jgi:integrase
MPAMRALCHVLTYAGCRVSESLALTIHHHDPERLTLTIRKLKRRHTFFRVVAVPQATADMMRMLPPGAYGRFWSLHRATAWRVVKATMSRAGIAGPMACPKWAAPRLRHSRCRPQCTGQPDSALDGPCLARHGVDSGTPTGGGSARSALPE